MKNGLRRGWRSEIPRPERVIHNEDVNDNDGNMQMRLMANVFLWREFRRRRRRACGMWQLSRVLLKRRTSSKEVSFCLFTFVRRRRVDFYVAEGEDR